MNTQKHFLTVKDNSVSKETFELLYDETLDLLITSPQPSEENLEKYYESDDYISHTDGKRSIFEKAYHFIKNVALKNKLSLINDLQQSKGNLLDIGAGTGIIAGGAIRAICEMLGMQDIVAKSIGSSNPYNVVRACMLALSKQRSPKDISILRGKKISEVVARR